MKRGPDLSWDDEEQPATPTSNKPEEQFPVRLTIHHSLPGAEKKMGTPKTDG